MATIFGQVFWQLIVQNIIATQTISSPCKKKLFPQIDSHLGEVTHLEPYALPTTRNLAILFFISDGDEYL